MGPFEWDQNIAKGEFDDNGNIITTLTKTDSNGYTLETSFTIINTENGWRISEAKEKLYGVPESDNYEENIQ